MPTDLAVSGRGPLIHIRDRYGTGLPFSKGLMATSILATGLETGLAHSIAADIERVLRRVNKTEVGADEIADIAARTIEHRAGVEAAQRYRAWRRAKRSGRPIVICLAGAPGVGKSTIATRLSLRLGINRVVPTDAVREVLRTVVPATLLPELHISTYESIETDKASETSLISYHRQAHAVLSASIAVAARMTGERRSVILEGAHLLPGEVGRHLAAGGSDAIVVELLLTMSSEDVHRDRLMHRLRREPAREGHRHLNRLPVIRLLQTELQRLAQAAEVAEHEITHPEDLTQRIVDQVVQEIDPSNKEEGDSA